ncbi:hypothetical protein Q0Z83_042750 [Actinoplanes sichuanensis]|uniref:Cytochrome P450 n=1 Tax=Actinoplanes sichuanensis TaxID=512349 RepID=A0ABW4A6N6_9ACTN|nr:cytochrome P450 [Actinoplanes sichuanensis]BEL06084.1 hypothetical protein Q0Z83_042750 [Actinoplanes sichuanensis]
MITELPSPPAWPVLGHLPALARGGRPHRVLEEWCDRYGSTYRLRLPAGPAVVTADPKIVQSILRGRPHLFRREPHIIRTIEATGVHGVFTAEGTRWHADRKAANDLLAHDPHTAVTRAVTRLRDRWSARAQAGQQIPVLADLMRLSLDVTLAVSTGQDLDAVDDPDGPLQTLIPRLFPAIHRRINAPFPLPRDRNLQRLLRSARDLLPVDHFGTVITLLLAGQDTTAAAAGWSLQYLAADPEEHARVRAEADEAFRAGEFTAEAVTAGRLRYTHAAVREAVRLRPPASLTVVEAVEAVELLGEDTLVHARPGIPIWVLMAYGARRFPDAAVFRPSRWLTDRAPTDAPYLPFGGGPRVCPGRDLALLTATAAVAMTARDFDLHTSGPPRERVAFTMRPDRLTLTLTPR